MVKRQRNNLHYYHTGRYKDLTNYKRRKIEKEIVEELNSRRWNHNHILESAFDETCLCLPRQTNSTFNQDTITADKNLATEVEDSTTMNFNQNSTYEFDSLVILNFKSKN